MRALFLLEASKPDSVLNSHLSRPSSLGAREGILKRPGRRLQRRGLPVSLSPFQLEKEKTRLCCSHALLIQSMSLLFLGTGHQPLRVTAYAAHPAFCCLDFPPQNGVAVLPPAAYIIPH